MSIEELLHIVALSGVAAQASAGMLEAGRNPLDLFGMIVIALVSALGGGTLRDVMIDRTVFWIADQSYLITGIVAALITFLAARRFRLPGRLFVIPDAIGMALFTVSGTQAALALGTPWLVASVMGVVTAVFGGILRDVLCNEIPLVFSSELYATASWCGALVLVGLHLAGFDHVWTAVAGGSTVLVLRFGALIFNWHLPVFRSR